jgi:hypothetical protein
MNELIGWTNYWTNFKNKNKPSNSETLTKNSTLKMGSWHVRIMLYKQENSTLNKNSIIKYSAHMINKY